MARQQTKRRAPVDIASIAALRDVTLIKAAIKERYGFEPPDEYCRDFVAFVDAVTGANSE